MNTDIPQSATPNLKSQAVFEFIEELPAKAGGQGFNAARSDEIDKQVEILKLNPGRWALVLKGGRSVGGRLSPFRHRGCDVATRQSRETKGLAFGYARWPVPRPEKSA